MLLDISETPKITKAIFIKLKANRLLFLTFEELKNKFCTKSEKEVVEKCEMTSNGPTGN